MPRKMSLEPRTRTFDGKVYELYVILSKKSESDREKKRLMGFGHKVRVTKSRIGHVIWWRK